MILFPIRTDRALHSTPWMNYLLIAANVIIFLAFRGRFPDISIPSLRQNPLLPYYLHPAAPKIWQFITYQFLHADGWHIIGNMIFLYVFGNSVEDRFGKVGYLFFYLGGGVVAGIGHALMDPAPVLGASGAVAAVTGAYLALFPLSNITLFYWIFFSAGTFELSSLLLILLQIIQNIFLEIIGNRGVAHVAHLSGYAYGFLIGMGLLGVRILPREQFDLLAMLERRKRRAEFRKQTREGFQPWMHNKDGVPPPAAAPQPTTAHEMRVMDMRAKVNRLISERDLPAAARAYADLIDLDPGQVLGRQQQVDLASQLMTMGRHDAAARAYELFIHTYRSDAQREEIELILGLLYARYLDRRQRARELLTPLAEKLTDPDRRALAVQLMAEVAM